MFRGDMPNILGDITEKWEEGNISPPPVGSGLSVKGLSSVKSN